MQGGVAGSPEVEAIAFPQIDAYGGELSGATSKQVSALKKGVWEGVFMVTVPSAVFPEPQTPISLCNTGLLHPPSV